MALDQKLIALDQLLNTFYKDGKADETISARAWRCRDTWKRRVAFIDWVFYRLLGEIDHCKQSYESEVNRTQLPLEYRTTVQEQ